jgi:hypothetical protein
VGALRNAVPDAATNVLLLAAPSAAGDAAKAIPDVIT